MELRLINATISEAICAPTPRMERSAAARVLPSRSTKMKGDLMSSAARMSAERKFAQLQITDDAARDQIEEEAAVRAKKIARLRNLRLAAIGDESESFTRTSDHKIN
jgi:hypothetical protein